MLNWAEKNIPSPLGLKTGSVQLKPVEIHNSDSPFNFTHTHRWRQQTHFWILADLLSLLTQVIYCIFCWSETKVSLQMFTSKWSSLYRENYCFLSFQKTEKVRCTSFMSWIFVINVTSFPSRIGPEKREEEKDMQKLVPLFEISHWIWKRQIQECALHSIQFPFLIKQEWISLQIFDCAIIWATKFIETCFNLHLRRF